MENITGVSEAESSYPKSWRWSDDGDHVFGRFIKFDRGRTREFGQKTICVLDVDGVERSVWLTGDVLFNKFREELLDRPGRTLTVGERVSIRRHEPKESENGRRYRPFDVVFADRPQPSTAQLFDLEPPTASGGDVADADDDIPY